MATPDTLLIDLGDVSSLALLALQPDHDRLMLWHERTSQGHLEAVQLHAEMCGNWRLIVSDAPADPLAEMAVTTHIEQAQLLMRAAALALHLKCRRILWPLAIGPDHLAIADALERASTIARIADPSGSLLIDAPNIDLDDAQLVELAEDAGAPMRGCWPCEHDDEQPCGSCESCDRWRKAFQTAGVHWPWTSAPITRVPAMQR